jgi:hypothetical protein
MVPSLAVTFPGLKLGIFDGNLRFTVYRGTNLLQMDAIARTNEPSVAYKYDAGLKGFSTATMPRVTWRDTGGPSAAASIRRAEGSRTVRRSARRIGCFWPKGPKGIDRDVPAATHVLLHARSGRQPWIRLLSQRRRRHLQHRRHDARAESDTFPSYEQNYALYNAPPGTWQKMQMFFYVSPEAGDATRQAALAFTHDDVFKAVPGYKTFVNHFHLRVTDRMRVGGFDTPLQDLIAMKAIGLNVVGLSDFHADSLAANDPGPLRFRIRRTTRKRRGACRTKIFLSYPGKSRASRSAGTTTSCGRRTCTGRSPVRSGGGRGAGGAAPTPLPFEENDSTYGKVYHTGNADKVQQLLDAEGGYWYHAHPRTKSTAGFPDATWGTKYLQNDRYLGVAFKPGMGQDNSEPTMCAWRCFDAVDTMNNMYAGMGIRRSSSSPTSTRTARAPKTTRMRTSRSTT